MDTPEIANAKYWAEWWEWIGDKAFIIVVVALTVEYLTGRWARPHRDALEHARETQVAQLTKDAARLSAEAETAKREIASANERAEQARLEQERLKAAVAWRVLTQEIGERLTAALATTPQTVTRSVTLVSVANDPESMRLGFQLAAVFRRAGWFVAQGTRTYNALILGIFVPDPSNETTLAIRNAFAVANISFGTDNPEMGGFSGQSPLPGTTPATIVIGSKPPPF